MKRLKKPTFAAEIEPCKDKRRQAADNDHAGCGSEHHNDTITQHDPEHGRRQNSPEIFPVGRVGDRVRLGIHLTGRLEAAKDQDHDRHEHDDNHDRQN